MKFSIDDILKKKEEDLTHTTSGLFLFFLFGNRRSFNKVNSIKSLNQATFYLIFRTTLFYDWNWGCFDY